MREFEKTGSFRLVVGFAAMLASAAYGCGADPAGASDVNQEAEVLADTEAESEHLDEATADAEAIGQLEQKWIDSCRAFTDIQNTRGSGYCEGGGATIFRYWIECDFFGIPNLQAGLWQLAGGGVSSAANCTGSFVDSGIDTFPQRLE